MVSDTASRCLAPPSEDGGFPHFSGPARRGRRAQAEPARRRARSVSRPRLRSAHLLSRHRRRSRRHAVAVKLQSAFFEVLGADGVRAFEEVCAYARAAGLLVIADAKRGDIGSTAAVRTHAPSSRGGPLADAITVNPYHGRRLRSSRSSTPAGARAPGSSASSRRRTRAAPTCRTSSSPTGGPSGSTCRARPRVGAGRHRRERALGGRRRRRRDVPARGRGDPPAPAAGCAAPARNRCAGRHARRRRRRLLDRPRERARLDRRGRSSSPTRLQTEAKRLAAEIWALAK